jgi:threonine dehydrogenase-like Zn-dependent dehydrogenase
VKALVLEAFWDLRVVDRAPTPPGPHEVEVAVHATGICGSDVHGFTGETGRREPGQVMGHEIVGTVRALGAEVRGVEVGWSVIVNPVMSCGECPSCRAGHEEVCAAVRVIGVVADRDAGFAESVVVPAANVVRFADGDNAYVGALVEPLAVGYHAARLGEVEAGSHVLVIGGGPIGQAVALGCERLGAARVLVAEPVPGRRELLGTLGFEALHPDDVDTALARWERPPDVVVDAVGARGTVRNGLRLVAPRGVVVLVGMSSPELDIEAYVLTTGERSLRGSFCYSADSFRSTAEWAGRHRDRVGPLIDRVVSLESAPEVFRGLADGSLHANKILVAP